eukprot:UC4_evm2s347
MLADSLHQTYIGSGEDSGERPGDGEGIFVYYPTEEEFKDFQGCISRLEEVGAHSMGIAKVVPPASYCAPKNYRSLHDIDVVIKHPIRQRVEGGAGAYQVLNMDSKSITVSDFRTLAESDNHRAPQHESNKAGYEYLERRFWKTIGVCPAIYGADVEGTVTKKSEKIWNINSLGTILDIVEEEGYRLAGVNTSYLYFGMWKAAFCWHTEDMDLYSINYIHQGAPKTWYAVPENHGPRLERLAQQEFPGAYEICDQFLRHKMTIFSPKFLHKYSIKCNKIVHQQGEFMITFPRGYHMGFNHGFNIAESTNFATDRWIDIGMKARSCKCVTDSVRICMDPFIRRFRPNIWEEKILAQAKLEEAARLQREAEEAKIKEEESRQQKLREKKEAAAAARAAKEKAKTAEKLERKRKREEERNARKLLKPPPAPPLGLDEERKYNIKAAAVSEGTAECCVCRQRGTIHLQSTESDGQYKKEDVDVVHPSIPNEFSIVVCKICSVHVHCGCYGITAKDISEGWTCERCAAGKGKVKCLFCPNSGGALKKTETGKWCHVECVLWIPGTYFENAQGLTGVKGTETISRSRWNLKCSLCRYPMSIVPGAQRHDDMFPALCPKHSPQNAKSKPEPVVLSVGQVVLIRSLRDGQLYKGNVNAINDGSKYKVQLEDGRSMFVRPGQILSTNSGDIDQILIAAQKRKESRAKNIFSPIESDEKRERVVENYALLSSEETVNTIDKYH